MFETMQTISSMLQSISLKTREEDEFGEELGDWTVVEQKQQHERAEQQKIEEERRRKEEIKLVLIEKEENDRQQLLENNAGSMRGMCISLKNVSRDVWFPGKFEG